MDIVLFVIIILTVLMILYHYHIMFVKNERFESPAPEPTVAPPSQPIYRGDRERAPHLMYPDCEDPPALHISEDQRGGAPPLMQREGETPGVKFTGHQDDILYEHLGL